MWPKNQKPKITLVDQNDRFVFKPLLYDLLTKTASEDEVVPEYAAILAPYNVRSFPTVNARAGRGWTDFRALFEAIQFCSVDVSHFHQSTNGASP